MEFNMDEAIRNCEEMKRDYEAICFGLGIVNFVPKWPCTQAELKRADNKLDKIKACAGFVGVHVVNEAQSLLIFRTLEDALEAKTNLENQKLKVGNVIPILVDKDDLEGINEE